ncbi:MAG: 1-acyl-sn-glycerol-3-phosphate acyltransferase [Deltaproteobacteria bacterium]|nr:MAG: 1-acyl-sn-glycerol-3-phosphate acyltransferase [Deltaproteobacteria bacterium]
MAAVMASAAGHLCLYRLSALVWGRSPGRALLLFRHWGRRTWDWLGVDVELHGTPPSRPCLYVANHRSYLDIPILAGVLGASFLSRADVAGWWVIGGAARAIDTVFVDREDPRARMRAARALARRLRTGSVVAFPEGTTGGAPVPGPFQPGLFRLLHRLRIPVVPVTIRYGDRQAYWTDDLALSAHLRRLVLGRRNARAAVHIGRPLGAEAHRDGQSLAGAAYRAVCGPIEAFGELVSEAVSPVRP